jgi:hypothetical protein
MPLYAILRHQHCSNESKIMKYTLWGTCRKNCSILAQTVEKWQLGQKMGQIHVLSLPIPLNDRSAESQIILMTMMMTEMMVTRMRMMTTKTGTTTTTMMMMMMMKTRVLIIKS